MAADIYFVRISQLRHTGSFKIALLFLLWFGAASAALDGFLYLRATGFARANIDDWLAREIVTLVETDDAEMLRRLHYHERIDPGSARPFAAFWPDGAKRAGNLAQEPRLPMPLDKPFGFTVPQDADGDYDDFPASTGASAVPSEPFRGIARRRPDGTVVLVSQDVRVLHVFAAVLLNAIVWSGLVSVLLALAGSTAIGLVALRRTSSLTEAIRRIMAGDLSRRLPCSGRSGDLERLVAVINLMLDTIEGAVRDAKGVCDGIAHDLRTPLTHLLAGLERTRRRDGGATELVAAVDAAIDQTRCVLDRFAAQLRLAELEDGARRAGFVRVDLLRVAKDVAELYAPVAEARSVILVVDETASAEMEGDPSLVFEAMGNLVDNAIKYGPVGGRVCLRANYIGGAASIRVSDEGDGIAEGQSSMVLRRFRRGASTGALPGHGLGLSLVAAIARLHGLDLRIERGWQGNCISLTQSRVLANNAEILTRNSYITDL